MKLNKSTSFTLLHLLGGAKSAAKIAEQMPAVNIRSIQRALVRLDNEGLVKRHGITNPKYALEYEQIPQTTDPASTPGKYAAAGQLF